MKFSKICQNYEIWKKSAKNAKIMLKLKSIKNFDFFFPGYWKWHVVSFWKRQPLPEETTCPSSGYKENDMSFLPEIGKNDTSFFTHLQPQKFDFLSRIAEKTQFCTRNMTRFKNPFSDIDLSRSKSQITLNWPNIRILTRVLAKKIHELKLKNQNNIQPYNV